MAKLRIFSVYDAKVEAFMRPFVAPTYGAAERGFRDAVQDKQSEMSKHPEDYRLMYLGLFDEESGMIEGIETGPESVVTGLVASKEG